MKSSRPVFFPRRLSTLAYIANRRLAARHTEALSDACDQKRTYAFLNPSHRDVFMKIIGWIILIIFLIGLAVVLGLGKLIF